MMLPGEFVMRAGPVGVLLIHGLTGTPSEMRFVAKGLHRAGFTVYGMKLAGHCGTADDLLTTGWRDWYRSVDDAATRLLPTVERLFVGGLSMGAVLALELAIRRPDDVAGVALYGTTFRHDGWTIPPIARLAFLLPVVCALGIGRRRMFRESFPYGIKDPRTRDFIVGRMLAGDSDAGGLTGNPWGSLAEFHRLSRHVRRRLSWVTSPCLAMHAVHDDIASQRNVEVVRRGVSGSLEVELLDDCYHMITVDRQRSRVIARSAAFFTRIAGGEVAGSGARRPAAADPAFADTTLVTPDNR